MLLGIEQKKGNKEHLDGRLTVFAVLDIDPAELMSMKNNIASMVYDKFLTGTRTTCAISLNRKWVFHSKRVWRNSLTN
jgi:hypothetical protein